MTPTSLRSQPFRAGARFACVLVLIVHDRKPIAGRIEWKPHVPSRLNAVERRALQRGANRAVAELVHQLGGGPEVASAIDRLPVSHLASRSPWNS